MAYTPEQLRAMNVINPDFAIAIKDRPFTIQADDPVAFRKLRADHLAALRHLMPLGGKAIPEVEEEDVQVTMRDGSRIRVRVYKPVKERRITHGGPLIMMFHEGGFMYGDLTDEEMNCRLFSREFGATCLNVEYRLATEHLFPTWAHDAWDATKWAAANAASLDSNPAERGFLVGGSSAGGNITAVLAQLSRTEGLKPAITGQYLPFENVHDPILQGLGAERLQAHVQRLGVDQSSPLYTPLATPSYPPSAASSSVSLAPAYFQVAGLDPLRDHALICADIMDEYGAAAKVDVYSGFSHMFWTNWPDMKQSHNFVEDTVKGVRWLLEESGLHLQR